MAAFSAHRLFHLLLGAVYLFAFASLLVQFDGLLSYNGLLPVDLFVDRLRRHASPTTRGLSSLQRAWVLFKSSGSLVVIAPELGVTPDALCITLLFVGLMSASLILFLGMHRNYLFLISWVSYLSLQAIGQTWLSFQWDILILEVGFLAILSSSFFHSSTSSTP